MSNVTICKTLLNGKIAMRLLKPETYYPNSNGNKIHHESMRFDVWTMILLFVCLQNRLDVVSLLKYMSHLVTWPVRNKMFGSKLVTRCGRHLEKVREDYTHTKMLILLYRLSIKDVGDYGSPQLSFCSSCQYLFLYSYTLFCHAFTQAF